MVYAIVSSNCYYYIYAIVFPYNLNSILYNKDMIKKWLND